MSFSLKTLAAIAVLTGVTPAVAVAANLAPLGASVRSHAILSPDALIDSGAIVQPGDETSLNPQPLPPKYKKRVLRFSYDDVAINPQPLPPRVFTLRD